MRATGLLVVAAVASIVACAASQPRVPVLGPAESVNSLVGEWRGEYFSTESGRAGSIYFLLRPGENTAAGDVVMIPSRGNRVVNWEDKLTIASARHLAEAFTVSFVNTESGMVSGRLEPYVDPDCGHLHLTTFFGEVRDGRISGGYISRSPSHEPHTGEWAATRVR